MKVTKAKVAENRAALLEAAIHLFQQKGFDGTSVAEISARAGLTQGAFYAQFASKAAIAQEACRESLNHRREGWLAVRGKGHDDLLAYMELYLSWRHLDNVSKGCALSALAAEGPRVGEAVQQELTFGYNELVTLLAEALPLKDAQQARSRAMVLMASMTGCLTMARAVRDLHPEMAEQILVAARRELRHLALSP
ncbi:TetR/AcrR family transcriptional regulator [Herbaspirillum huttiense]|uniref:TetR/AcrR family transcriptional regulator n=1 Tax=Herbaspirillum huttiense TaxID=863372 RepID=UPI0039AFEEB7